MTRRKSLNVKTSIKAGALGKLATNHNRVAL
jgi:hypothetical protein